MCVMCARVYVVRYCIIHAGMTVYVFRWCMYEYRHMYGIIILRFYNKLLVIFFIKDILVYTINTAMLNTLTLK